MCEAVYAVLPRLQVSGIVGERRDDCGRTEEWYAEAQRTVVQEVTDSFSLQAPPHKQTGYEEHERHKEGVIESHNGVSASPFVQIHNRERLPPPHRSDK